MRTTVWIAVAAALVASTQAKADMLYGEVGLGYLATDGNTKSRSLNAKFALDYATGPWKNAFLATALNTDGDDGAATERYAVSDKLDREFTRNDYAFGVVEYEKDLHGALRQRTSEAIGYGRHVLDGPAHFLDLEIGGGARQSELNVTGKHQDEAIARLSGKYEWRLSEKGSFVERIKVESGKDNTVSESVTELRLPIYGSLSASLSYALRNNTDVPPGTEHTDTATSVALTYIFGAKS